MIEKALPRVGHGLALTSPWIDRAASGAAYRSEIDGLRALAVVPVVLYHAGLSWLPGGYVGVDVFFVISGFLITRQIVSQILAGQFSATEFYARRILRIFPPLLLVIAGTLAAAPLFPLLARELRTSWRDIYRPLIYSLV